MYICGGRNNFLAEGEGMEAEESEGIYGERLVRLKKRDKRFLEEVWG